MGCNVQVHEKANSRGTWVYHTVKGWYINTSPEHYRTHTCHIKERRNERFSDTVYSRLQTQANHQPIYHKCGQSHGSNTRGGRNNQRIRRTGGIQRSTRVATISRWSSKHARCLRQQVPTGAAQISNLPPIVPRVDSGQAPIVPRVDSGQAPPIQHKIADERAETK